MQKLLISENKFNHVLILSMFLSQLNELCFPSPRFTKLGIHPFRFSARSNLLEKVIDLWERNINEAIYIHSFSIL